MQKVVSSSYHTTFHIPHPIFHLSGPLKDLLDAPSFFFAKGTGLDEQNFISNMALISFIMSLNFRPFPDIFFIDRMEDEAIHHHDDGFVHLIA